MRLFAVMFIGVLLQLAACRSAPPAEPGRDAQGMNGAVTAGHPLAAEAGLQVLRQGGNAMDAAITMAAVLAVARPHMNGLGGDMFLLYYEAATGTVHGLNASGRSGSRADLQSLRKKGLEEMPETGPMSVSVPGAVRGWAAALERFGTFSWSQALEPAATLAREGLPVSERLALDLQEEQEKLEADAEAAHIYLPGGTLRQPGTRLRQDDLAVTLNQLRDNGPDELYTGATARRIVDYLAERGGFLTREDMAGYEPEWVAPISTEYHGLTVFALPPNTQGVSLLQELVLLRRFDFRRLGHNSADYLHTLAEVIRLASTERDAQVADPAAMRTSVEELLDAQRLQTLATTIDPRGRAPRPDDSAAADHPNTVYLIAVDRDGNVVSMIQSLFHSFGSGLVVPGTGVVLHNRGSLFSLDPDHPNRLAPRKRPFHTLCPALALREGKPWLAWGTPGGLGQTHTLIQVLNNILLFGMSPQEAIDAPRLRWYASGTLAIEDRVPVAVREALEARGYTVRPRHGWTAELGGAQAILIDPASGTKRAGADRRREGWALAY